MKSFRCTFGPIMQTDYVWPPPPADLEGCIEVPTHVAGAGESGEDIAEQYAGTGAVEHGEAGAELQWPPPPADLDGCSVVRLSEEVDADGDPVHISVADVQLTPADAAFVEAVSLSAPELSVPELPPSELPPPPLFPDSIEADVPTQPITPLSVVTGLPLPLFTTDVRAELDDDAEELDENEDEDAHAFFIPPSPEPPAEAERPRGSGFAWAAVFAAISCGAVAYSEFQAGRREARRPVFAESVPSPDAVPELPVKPNVSIVAEQARAATPTPPAIAKAAPPPVPPRTVEPKRRPEPEPEPRVVTRAAVVTPPSRPPVSQSQPTPKPAAAPAPAPAPARTAAATATPVRETPQVTAPTTLALATPAASPEAEPIVRTAAIDTSTEAASAAVADEEHIESTLTRFRTAYSNLDARAAREVWPSVNVEALDRAFRGLKSQELRFDRCDLTVDGARARAACRGRAVYVPRVGNQSPKAAPREWTFELQKANQRWTIASARSS